MPGRVDLEERELDERPLGHARDASARPLRVRGRARGRRGPSGRYRAGRTARDAGDAAAGAEDLGAIADAVPGIAPGVMSGGLGRVPASQTYLEITQGNRLFTSLYPETLTPLYVTGDRVPADLWDKVVDRAADAPADVEPGRLASALDANGVTIAARPLAGSPALIAADRLARAGSAAPTPVNRESAPG